VAKHWKVRRSYEVERQHGSDDREPYMRIYTIVPVGGGGEESQTTVEFDLLSVKPSKNAALIALRRYLEREPRPPRRLIVRRDRTVAEFDE
jgi:hypothetical protein